MGHGRPSHSRCSRASDGESAVTPVIGAILILAITILGIAGVLYWGAPMIDRIQAQNAQVAVVGEFQDLRDASTVLSVPDHSRFPTIVIPRGDLGLEKGSRIMVTSDRDNGATFEACDFRVTNWADTATATKDDVTIGALTNCRGQGTAALQLQVYQVSGATLVCVHGCSPAVTAAAGTVTPNPAVDFSLGDWLFRLVNTACPDSGICAEAWLHSGDKVAWNFRAGSGIREVNFENGAIFSDTDGTLFLEREATMGDSVFGSTYYGFWLRSLAANSYDAISGAGSHQVYLSLLGNYDRVESATTIRLRFDVSGDLAEGWCNSLLARNTGLPDNNAPTGTRDGLYTVTTGSTCATTSDATGVRSVSYTYDDSDVDSTRDDAFTFRFLHARIYTSIAN